MDDPIDNKPPPGYLTHPQAQYFAVGKIDKDQVQSYTARKDQELSVTERWLAPNLGHDN